MNLWHTVQLFVHLVIIEKQYGNVVRLNQHTIHILAIQMCYPQVICITHMQHS